MAGFHALTPRIALNLLNINKTMTEIGAAAA
jgi:hypothetical protein